MIAYPAAYSAKLHSSTIDVDWIFSFLNDNAGYVYLSCKDRISANIELNIFISMHSILRTV